MANKKSHNYILVLTNEGPKFVTKLNYSNGRTAEWDKLEKPLELDANIASDVTLGLNLNGHNAYRVSQPFEIETQPCMYNRGHYEWKWNEEKKDSYEQGFVDGVNQMAKELEYEFKEDQNGKSDNNA